jgi:hypothetical protein
MIARVRRRPGRTAFGALRALVSARAIAVVPALVPH